MWIFLCERLAKYYAYTRTGRQLICQWTARKCAYLAQIRFISAFTKIYRLASDFGLKCVYRSEEMQEVEIAIDT
jgi:ATP-dependent RNA circularization protein (DNA/RNA ligase family)